MVLPDEQWKSREVARLLALVETERRYWQEIVANLPVPVAILNRSLAVVSANRLFRTTYGVSLEDLNTKRITDIIPAPSLAAAVQSMYDNGAVPEPMLFETEAGKRVRVTLQQHRDWDEDAVDALVTIEELPEESAKLPAAVPAVIWTALLPSLDFTFLSPSAEPVTGLPAADWKFYDRIEEADRDAVRAIYTQAISAGSGMYSAEFRLAGRKRWFRETVRVQDGALHGVLTDVTGRRAMDEHLLQAQRVDALAGFSGRAAHDLNNPLMIVNGYGEEVLAAMPEADPHRADMTQVMDAAKRISDITAGLQAFARKPAAPASLSQFPVADAIGDQSAKHLLALGDATEFQAVVKAIIAAMDGAPVTTRAAELTVRDLTIGAQPVEPGSYVLVRIECQASEPLKRPLFESPHLRPELAKAFRTIESWGGSCWTSPDNRVIRILLKRAVEAVPEPVAVEPPTKSEPKRILVVDDEMGIRTLMRKILLREGYTVVEAGGGAEALAILEKQPVDLLLTDVIMPEITGRQVAEKAVALYPAIKVLYVSGYTDETLVETGKYPPGSQLLQKPFTLNSLLKKVGEVLGQ
ncbi:hypothetical protein F183_A20060 [Bryobacterales bacterium F-183]|nr:hypothetical protein F183_A20060 [Bryobacterales bacterium F-183]